MRTFLLEANSLLDYILLALRKTSLWGLVTRITTFSRRFMLVTRILRWTAIAVAYIETSAILLVTATLAFAVLPFAALLTLVIFAADNIRASLILRRLPPPTGEIWVIFAAGEFGMKLAKELDGSVYLVRGQLESRFLTMKRKNGITLISSSFFIRLRRRYFDRTPENMRYLF